MTLFLRLSTAFTLRQVVLIFLVCPFVTQCASRELFHGDEIPMSTPMSVRKDM